MQRIVGRCGNCGAIVWSDQDFVRWEGIVPIHRECWKGDPDPDTGRAES